MENEDEKEVEQGVGDAGHEEDVEGAAGVALAAQDGGTKDVDHEERHAEKIDAQIENGHVEDFGGRGHGAQDGACQGGAKHHEGKTAHKGHNGHR